MLPSNSSTSSFNRLGHRALHRQVLAVLCWTILALVLLDLAVGRATRPPADGRKPGNVLQVYFDYGTSIEKKLHRALGSSPDREAEILKAGWLAQECDGRVTPADAHGISVYGNSFSGRITRQLIKLDPQLRLTIFAGPGAPPSHSYACFLRRQAKGIDHNPVQIMGVLASSLRKMETTSGTSTTFEQPQPYTYPRFVLRNGRLSPITPSIGDEAGLRGVLASHGAWLAYMRGLVAQDRLASPFMANHNFIDDSVILRLIRRAWGQRHLTNATAALRGDGDFAGDPDLIPSLQAILADFAARSRAQGARPIILLFEDRGYDGVLRRLVAPALAAQGISYMLSADVAPATDASAFIADGHFRPDIDAKMAQTALKLIRASAPHGR